MKTAVRQHIKTVPEKGTDEEKEIDQIAFQLRRPGFSSPAFDMLSPAEQLVEVYEKLIEPTLIDPCFVTRVPSVIIPLAKPCANDPYFADVYELAINGQEISPGYTELNDPDRQAEQFRRQVGGGGRAAGGGRGFSGRAEVRDAAGGGDGPGDRPAGDAAAGGREHQGRDRLPADAAGGVECGEIKMAKTTGKPKSKPTPKPKVAKKARFRNSEGQRQGPDRA